MNFLEKAAAALLQSKHVAPKNEVTVRQTVLGSEQIAYTFKRSKRRTIGFSVGPQGLAVRAPRWVALRDVELALQEKAVWIVKKLREARQRQAQLEATRQTWHHSSGLQVLGQHVRLLLDAAYCGVQLTSAGDLQVGLPPDAAPERVQALVQAWLMEQARQLFAERVAHFAPQLGVQCRRLSLSNASTRWGSASANGSIRLHWRLMHYTPAVIDYVVVHELSHLRVMNHSPQFWAVVGSVLPDYMQLREQLKEGVSSPALY